MYELRNATNNDKSLLINFKLSTIFDDNESFKNEVEKEKITKYVKANIAKYLNEYKIITVKKNIAGAFLIRIYNDGFLLDEIYLLEEYRCKGIGSNIISNIQHAYPHQIYLWVYKNNYQAINLYKKLNFKIIEETETRYMMLYKAN